jgi:hypothetical protein
MMIRADCNNFACTLNALTESKIYFEGLNNILFFMPCKVFKGIIPSFSPATTGRMLIKSSSKTTYKTGKNENCSVLPEAMRFIHPVHGLATSQPLSSKIFHP